MDLNKHLIAINAAIALNRLTSEWADLRARDDAQRKLLRDNCQHPSITENRKYYEGGYDYVSQVVVTRTCNLCNKTLECFNDPSHKGSHA